MRSFVAILVLSLATSSTWADPKPDPKTPPSSPGKKPNDDASPKKLEWTDDDTAAWLKFFDGFVDLVLAANGDCDRMAATTSKHFDENSELLTKAQAAQRAEQTLPKHAQDHVIDGLKKMAGALQKCSKHEGMRRTLARLPHK